ncbi:2-hydroxyacid dehydrogenase [Ensifer sp. YR511]|uniref:2-hydroxyacid dehydrogenase n=1 Tax=Ensifer sp. YR511 TaxID=1855294 RepID=UPI000885025A|nr:2-hydroxyacid dehydrogenase [Ensifer sp. YR511]SDO07594.1 hydroxypyruvate reductase 2 [Ensifer sp. YR511]
MKPEVVLVGPLMDSVMSELETSYHVHRLYDPLTIGSINTEKILAVVTDGALGAGRSLLERFPKLELLGVFGVGLDAVDLAYTRHTGISVANTPDVLTNDVADLAILLMLAVARGQIVADRFVRDGKWGKEALPLAFRFTGKEVGILGLGRVGRAVAKRCAAFDCAISFVDPFASETSGLKRYGDLREMAANVDFLVVTAAGGSETGKIVDAEILDALGPKGALINVSRGSIVDEQALVDALLSGRLAAAGLDVFANEPCVPKELFTMDQVVLTPHRASATVETREAMGRLLLDNLAAHFSGKPLLTPVI